MQGSKNELLESFSDFCRHREECLNTRKLDLRECNWFYPTALLPLGSFLKENIGSIDFVPPSDSGVRNYFSIMTDESTPQTTGGTYVPIASLPKDQREANAVLERIFRLMNPADYGGEGVMKYFVSELTDNMYQHSKFTNAFIMAQRYRTKGFTEVCFFDNGISIPGCIEANGLKFDDTTAIVEAINGLSTKNQERGFGLGTSLNIFTKGLGGEVLLVSRKGAVYWGKNQLLYSIGDIHMLQGTLIGVRIPYPSREVNVYDFIE